MKKYQHTQPATAIVVCMGAVSTGLALKAITFHRLVIPAIILGLATWIFRSLTIEITDTELVWNFGSGFLRKRVGLSEIASAEAIRTTFLNGCGMHNTSRGWLYNVSGYGAVAITLRNGRRFCLGTDEPEVLAGRVSAECGVRNAE